MLDFDLSLDSNSEERTLEAEVDAYLGEPLTKTASLDYWKVCVTYLLHCHCTTLTDMTPTAQSIHIPDHLPYGYGHYSHPSLCSALRACFLFR